MTQRALHATIRFGLGPRPDQPLPSEPEAWLLAQVAQLPVLPGPTIAECGTALRTPRLDGSQHPMDGLVRRERAAWADRMIQAEAGFAERWAELWGNHLSISRRAAGMAGAAAAHYHRHAIRPHVFGAFEDMLIASASHPAMLAFLDNAGSVGPNSIAGRRRQGRGATENMAREMLELHTLGVDGGYAQADVQALALMLSGWSIGRGPAADEAEGFMFRPGAHEPGPKRLLGETFPEGQAGALEALRHLARHPATCRRLARRIAIHFIADDPPEPAVAALERSLLDSGTDLGAAARTLISLPEAWEPLAKLASPQDYAIGVLRALGLGPEGASALLMALDRLGQPVWMAPAPDGWPDRGRAWAAPDLVVRRLEWASELAGRLDVAARQDPLELLALTRGAFAPQAVRQGISAAATLRDGYILALAHPAMHRR